jgi:hypothetical protein
MRKPIIAIVILLALAGVVASAGVVRADLTATGVVWSWDETQLKYQNSMINISWYDGTWKPFWHEMTFNNDPWLGTPNPCAVGTTSWAGIMYYAVGHEDTQLPIPAPGFQKTRNWELVDCDRDGDGDGVDNGDLAFAPPTSRVTLEQCTASSTSCILVSEDITTGCSVGNCATELVTTFLVNLDADCDGNIDAKYDIWSGGKLRVCFFAEAQVPTWPTEGPMWTGNVQGRIGTVGGAKTINFNPITLAVELASFRTTPQAWTRSILLEWETVSEVDNVGFNLYRADSPSGRQIRLNAGLLPSQGPGSPFGFKYSFVDRTALAGRTYYYWLEDLSTYGWYTKHGPVLAAISPTLSVPRRTP